MAEPLHVELVAADREVWAGDATIVVTRTSEGDIGIMAGHESVLATLAIGPVTITTTDGTTVRAAVHGGFLAVSGDEVSILAEVVELAEDIDASRAREDLANVSDDKPGALAARRRAEVRMQVAGQG